MCVTCGCSGDDSIKITNSQTGETVRQQMKEGEHYHTHTLPDGTVITHSHTYQHDHHHPTSSVDSPRIHAQMHGTTISLEQDILRKNDLIAAQNRGWFKGRDILALNLVSSPGAGKNYPLNPHD